MSKKNRANKMIRQDGGKTVEEIAKQLEQDKKDGHFSNTENVNKTGDIYDPNFQDILSLEEEKEETKSTSRGTESVTNKNIGGSKMEKKNNTEVTSGFSRPLNMQYGVTSLEFLSKFKALIAEKMPELTKCAGSVAISVSENAGKELGESQVKFILKLDLTNSAELKRQSTKINYNADVDPQFEALFEKSQNEATNSLSQNYKKMPMYLQEKGKNILYNDYFDVIKFEPFRGKDGRVWDNLVLMEVNASASILTILDLDTKLYIGYTDSVRRMRQFEESVKLKQRMKGKTGIQVPVIYLIQVNVDDLELLKSSSAMFKKPNYQQGSNKGGNSYKAALADFFGK